MDEKNEKFQEIYQSNIERKKYWKSARESRTMFLKIQAKIENFSRIPAENFLVKVSYIILTN